MRELVSTKAIIDKSIVGTQNCYIYGCVMDRNSLPNVHGLCVRIWCVSVYIVWKLFHPPNESYACLIITM